MRNRKQEIGKKGESIAIRYLKKQGYKIIAQNYRSKAGEIDIIARERKTRVVPTPVVHPWRR